MATLSGKPYLHILCTAPLLPTPKLVPGPFVLAKNFYCLDKLAPKIHMLKPWPPPGGSIERRVDR